MTGTGTGPRRLSPPELVGVVLAAFLPALVVRVKLHGVEDPDSFWHVLSGRQVWQERTVVTGDPFAGHDTVPWLHVDWLSDLVMAGADRLAGHAGVALLFVALDIALVVTLYVTCRLRAGVLVSAMAAVLGLLGSFASLAQRPQTVSFVLLTVVTGVWLRVAAEDDPRPVWWLVPLTWVWACLHGLWFTAPAIGAAVVAGMALTRRHPLRRLVHLAAVPLLSVVVAALTPLGPQLLLVPLTVRSLGEGLVMEFARPEVTQPNVLAVLALLAVVVVTWAVRRTLPWPHVLLWGVALVGVLTYQRTIAVAAVIAAPLAAQSLGDLSPRLRRPGGRDRWAVVAAGVATTVVAAALAPSLASAPRGFPTALLPELRQLPPGTVVLDDDHTGGWLLYEVPALRPVVDTRTYLFEDAWLRRYRDARFGAPGWERFVDESGAEVALLRPSEPLARLLTTEAGWTAVAGDEAFVLLTRPDG